MSSDFTKILVKDDRMECCDNIKYAVIKGGQNVTPSQFRAISTSNNQLVFNIQVPSEQTLIDRRVLLQTDLTLVVTSQVCAWAADGTTPANLATTAAAPTNGCGYGTIASLAPYPLHQMMTVASATINNNTVSINMKDVLPAIIRMLDKEELGTYNGTTVTQTDTFLSYSDTLFNASPACGSTNTTDTAYCGRGSLYLKNYSAVISSTGPPTTTETFTWHISEPLMLSPFIYCNPKSNGQAFYGIQNMNIVLNIGSDLSRVFRGCQYINGIPQSAFPLAASNLNTPYDANAKYPSPAGAVNKIPGIATGYGLPYILSVAPGSDPSTSSMFSNTYLLFTFLTAHPSDLYPARNIVPYYELPRYITTTSVTSPPIVAAPYVNGSSVQVTQNRYPAGLDTTAGTLLTSQTLQLNQIPDKLLLFIRKQGQGVGDSDSYLPITHLSIDFNNNSGLLSAARCEDLYRMSKDNGSNQNWNEWVGFQTSTAGGESASADGNNYIGLLTPAPIPIPLNATSSTTPVFTSTATCGGVCVLEFGKDIQLIEDFFAPGSLGNFNIRVNIYYNNNSPSLVAGSAIELVMITMNSGVFVCERGTSSTYTGILTRADVLEASEQDAYTRSDVKRMVGGGFLDMLKSGVSKLAPLAKAVAPHVMPHAKEFLSSKGALGKLASQGIGAMGYGMSGGGGSGGRLHGRYV